MPDEVGVAPVLSQESSSRVVEDAQPVVKMSWFERRLATGRHCITLVVSQAWTLALLLKQADTPWRAKIAAGVTVAYLVSPIQLIPSFIPVIGQMDDLAVLYCGMKLIRRWAPGDLIADCEARAKSSPTVQRLRSGCRDATSERRGDVARQGP
jgi:uncharacterized membrane protein YkvA (DUF1232 family)